MALTNKAQSGLHFSWGMVILVIVTIVSLAVLFIFLYPRISPGSFNNSSSGFGTWLINAFSAK